LRRELKYFLHNFYKGVLLVEKRSKFLIRILAVGVLLAFAGAGAATVEAAVYASPVAVWGVPMVPVVVSGTTPVIISPPLVPLVVGYPWGGAYYYGPPLSPGYVYTGGYYSLPYTAVIIQK
jgi:hypothetical protein